MNFQPFQKVPRLTRRAVVTEKIDGTNASIIIVDARTVDKAVPDTLIIAKQESLYMMAGSRNRFITPTDDNFGFANWVRDNAEALFQLGAGQHFGEWWGAGIQRGYGKKDKTFSMFNVGRWNEDTLPRIPGLSVVPILFEGMFDTAVIDDVLYSLRDKGSVAAPGFMNPEGIIVFHSASGQIFKKTLDNNDEHKG